MRAGDTSLAVSKDEDEDGADSQRWGEDGRGWEDGDMIRWGAKVLHATWAGKLREGRLDCLSRYLVGQFGVACQAAPKKGGTRFYWIANNGVPISYECLATVEMWLLVGGGRLSSQPWFRSTPLHRRDASRFLFLSSPRFRPSGPPRTPTSSPNQLNLCNTITVVKVLLLGCYMR